MKLRSSTAYGALAVFMSLFSAAHAADIYGERTTPADAYSQPYIPQDQVNWAGLYFGGYAGYGIATKGYEDSPFGWSFESPILTGIVGFDIVRGNFVFGPFAEYTYITADEAEDVYDWSAGLRAGIVVAPRTLLYGTVGYAQIGNDDVDIDGLRVGLGTEFSVAGNIFVDTKVNYTWYDLEEINAEADAGDLRALVGLKLKLNSDILK